MEIDWDRRLGKTTVKEDNTLDHRRQFKRFRIAAEAILDLCIARDPPMNFTTMRGIPPDAQCLGVSYDHLSHCFMLLICHPSFEAVPWNAIIPTANITVLTQVRADILVVDTPRPIKPQS